MQQAIKDAELRTKLKLSREQEQVTTERLINEKVFGADAQEKTAQLQRNVHDLQSQLYYVEIEVKTLKQIVVEQRARIRDLELQRGI